MTPICTKSAVASAVREAGLALFALYAGACVAPVAPAQDGQAKADGPGWWTTATGSWGDYSPKAFLEACPPAAAAAGDCSPFRVLQIIGPHTVECPDGDPAKCTREKSYGFFEKRSQMRTTSINEGVGTPVAFVERFESPSMRTIKLEFPNNISPARLDGTSVSSRLQFENAQSITVSRNDLYSSTPLGHIEGEQAGSRWVSLSPFSYYYYDGDLTRFGATSVEDNFGLYSIFREGTHICRSDAWQMNTGLRELLASDRFDLLACERDELLVSRTTTTDDLAGLARKFFLDRYDSRVTYPDSNDDMGSYYVKARKEWFCPFDCDGTTYSVHPSGEDAPPAVLITTDRWNFQSTSAFKVKVVRADWNRDGSFVGVGADHRDVAAEPAIYDEIVAIVVTEMKDPIGDGLGSGRWTQNTHVIFPPLSEARRSIFDERFVGDRDRELLYNIKLLDAVLALMPDQVQNSVELRDVEEKLDELYLLKTLAVNRGELPDRYYVDFLFDIFSPYDTTTAPTWQRPLLDGKRVGKVEFILDKLGY